VNLLSKEAQAVIGQVHDKTRPAIRLLKSEGFSWTGYVDIFDAGPTVEARASQIRSVQNSDQFTVNITSALEGQDEVMMINGKMVDFRATSAKAKLDVDNKQIFLTQQVADALLVAQGDIIRAAKLV
jgi:arginine N-succinyltransferase